MLEQNRIWESNGGGLLLIELPARSLLEYKFQLSWMSGAVLMSREANITQTKGHRKDGMGCAQMCGHENKADVCRSANMEI